MRLYHDSVRWVTDQGSSGLLEFLMPEPKKVLPFILLLKYPIPHT